MGSVLSSTEFDIAIVGGGLVGASLAVALAPLKLRVAVVEAFALGCEQQPSYDDRATALSNGSRRIFAGTGVWPNLEPHACPIKTIHVSDQGRFGMTRIRHREEGVDALGYVVENRVMGRVLAKAMGACHGVRLICPVKVKQVSVSSDFAEIVFTETTADGLAGLRAKLLVAADGARSLVRDQLGIGVRIWDYEQTAIIANVTPDLFHEYVAYERFTESGPLAVLPLSATQGDNPDPKRCTVVFTVDTADVEAVLGLSDLEFLACLQQRFGFRLGRFEKTGHRQSYPLALTQTKAQVAQRTAIIGNAAHALHPIAGQGFNLGLRDVAALAETVADAVAAGLDFGTPETLQQYAQWRRQDQKDVVRLTDGLVRLFRNPLTPVRMARNLGLLGLDLIPGAKGVLARQTMGLAGRLPKLARGVALK